MKTKARSKKKVVQEVEEKKPKKLQEKHFEIYKAECDKWIKIVGLGNWFITYNQHDFENTENLGEVEYVVEDRIATIYLNSDYSDKDPTEEEIRRAAFHEVWELVLGRMNNLSQLRFCNESEINDSRHEIIRILENVLWPKY